MLNGLLLTLNILVCLALIAVVLLQRSEGGALGGGGSPTGLITTRGAGDLLTRTTWILFAAFLTISLALTLLGGRERSSEGILNRLKLQSINPNALPAPGPARPVATANTAPPPTVQLPAATAERATAPAAGALSAPTPSVSLAPLPTPAHRSTTPVP